MNFKKFLFFYFFALFWRGDHPVIQGGTGPAFPCGGSLAHEANARQTTMAATESVDLIPTAHAPSPPSK